jgi:hypothetical protein
MTELNMSESEVIFDLTNPNNKYKGVMFAEVDNQELDREMQSPFPTPQKYAAGVMAIIWVDEEGIWNAKMRFKFPSGNKQVITKKYDVEAKEGETINENIVLQDLYRFPMIHKMWLKNDDETGHGIIELIEKAEMVQYIRIEK